MNRSSAAAAVGLALILMFAATASAATPTISYSIDGIPGTNGWYRGSTHGDNVILHWSVSLDATSSNCLPAITIPGPTAGTTQSCWAQNAAGRTTAVTRIKIDATPPTGVTAHFSRRPDFHGWYNRPVKIHWSGADATSGIAACSSATYRGPDSGAATANGGCTDKAGNSAIQPVHLPYDATPPVLRHVTEESTAASDVLSWISSSPSDRIVIVYSLRSVDEAGNVSKAVSVAGLPKFLTLSKTPYVVRAAPSPTLRWRRVRGAAYYNVQLFRGSKRIYSAWPTMHQVGLPPGWRWSGRHYSLRPAQYRWYVWAGFGARRLARYRLVGSARFAVPRWEK